MKKHQQGFTLIELMIVVAIIGILAAIAIPQYSDFVARSQMGEALSLTSGLKAAVVDNVNQGVTPSSGANGIPAAASVTGKYVNTVTVGGTAAAPTIQAAMKATGVSTAIASATLTLTGTFQGGSVSWACTSSAAAKYLPQACRP